MIQRRRVLYVLNSFEHDAPNSVIAAAGEAMEALGWEVKYIAWSRGGPLGVRLAARDATTVVLGRGLIGGAISLARIIRSFNPDIIHASLARPTIGAACARFFTARNSARWISSDHGVHEWHEKGRVLGSIMNLIMPAILSTMDMVLAVSESAASALVRRGVPAHRIHIIPNGIDVRRFYPRPKVQRGQFLKEQFPDDLVTPDIFLIGSAGNLRTVKGFDVLIQAMAIVLTKAPHARLVIWGEGPQLERLENNASIQAIDYAIHFCGYDAELEHKLPLLDLYVQPSRTESFGMAAAEAMASGVPAIVSSSGGLPFLVQNGKSGLVFPLDDSERLAEEIINMISNKRQRMKLANAGRLRVLHYFTRQQMVARMQQVYGELLGEGGS